MKLDELLKENPGLPQGALKAAMEKHRKLNEEKLGEQLVALLGEFEGHLQTHVANVRGIRKMEREAVAKLKLVNTALEHFKSKGNPFPMFKVLGQKIAAERFANRVGLEVPDDKSTQWEAK